MKKLFLAIFIITSALSCSKSIDTQSIKTANNTDTTESRRWHKKHIPTNTVVYTANFSGTSSSLTSFIFSANFPAFNSAKGTLTSWKLTMNRIVSGTLTITNLLSVINDSAIAIDRYTIMEIGGTTIELPDQVVNRLQHTLSPNQTLNVPINVNVDDEINSTNLTPVLGSSTDVLTWNFTDVVDAYKPNCTNSYDLTDNVTITLTYTYVQKCNL